MSERTIPEILSQLAGLRERPAADSTWLVPAARDERLRWALEQARAVLVEIDRDARVVFVSPSVEQVTGYTAEQFCDLRWDDGDLPVLRVRRESGELLYLEIASHRHGAFLLCDVTARQQAWSRLRESEDRYRAIVAGQRDAILEVDDLGRSTFQTGAARELFGFATEDTPPISMFELVHPDDRPRVEAQLRAAFRSGETVELKPFRMRRKDGHWIWYECTGLSYRRADGQRRFICVGRDCSERHREEEERRALEGRMQQIQRLESLGVLAGGIAHDFNNLLTPILGEARLALGDLPASSPVRDRIERVLRAATRAADLTRKMLANAGAESPRPDRLDLSELVDEMAHLVGNGAREGVEIRYELAEHLPTVVGDATQVGQVVTNLVANALESLADGPAVVAIRTGELALAQALPNHVPGLGERLPPGRYVFLDVEDTGCGMGPETLSRIFDPFFTTKFTGRGLGLSAVLGIVRSHEGGIEIDSRPGRGTRFRVLFPAP